MRKALLSMAMTTGMVTSFNALGASLEERLETLEKRIQYLEQLVQTQDHVIREKEARITELREPEGGGFQDVEVGALIEVEAGYHNDFDGESSSDIVLATAELGVSAWVNEWVAGEITLLYEEDDTPLEVDVAIITVAPPDGPWFVNAGQYYLPFGVFDTNMISDPLTLEIGETRESAIQAGFGKAGGFGSVYVFNGTNREDSDDRIDNWGANLGYGVELERFNLVASLGYINDIGDSDALQDALGTNDVPDYTGGWSLSARVESGAFTVIGEYVTAAGEFDPGVLAFNGRGAEPSAWNLEVGYGFWIGSRDAVFAVGYQGTDDGLALELPERRLVTALSVDIMEHTALSFEWAHDKDYDVGEGGTGESGDTLTTQLAVEF